MKKGTVIYQGKAKSLYRTDDEDHLVMSFRDDATAFNGKKHEQLTDKGMLNNYINEAIMQSLQSHGVNVHFVERVSDTESLVKNLEMIPLECVIRNVAAGSLCQRLGLDKGHPLNPPIFEFYLKNDRLNDPMVNDAHIITLGYANVDQLSQMRKITQKVNDILVQYFLEYRLVLVDFKLEFGLFHGELVLGDEFTLDGCRLWDKDTHTVFDKDRFRQDLGDVIGHYRQIAERLNIELPAAKA